MSVCNLGIKANLILPAIGEGVGTGDSRSQSLLKYRGIVTVFRPEGATVYATVKMKFGEVIFVQ